LGFSKVTVFFVSLCIKHHNKMRYGRMEVQPHALTLTLDQCFQTSVPQVSGRNRGINTQILWNIAKKSNCPSKFVVIFVRH